MIDLCLCRRHSLGARLSCTAENYVTMSGNECNVSYVILHAPDLETYRRTQLYVVQRHIAPHARLRLVWGSLTLAQLKKLSFTKNIIHVYGT